MNNSNTMELPIGTIVPFGLKAEFIPKGWLICDGRAISKFKHRELYQYMIHTPNLSGRTPIGTGLFDGTDYSLGDHGGSNTHQLTIDEMPSHTHGYRLQATPGGAPNQSVSFQPGTLSPLEYPTSYTGGDEQGVTKPHNIMQPYYSLNFIIYAGNE